TVTCSSSGLTASGAGSSVTWSLTLEIGRASCRERVLATTASIATHVTFDPDTSAASNSSTNHTTVSRSADLVISKTGPATATAGTNISYSITVTNYGPSDSAAFTVTDVLPAGTSFVLASPACAYDNPTRTVTCSSSGLTASGAGSSVTWSLTL